MPATQRAVANQVGGTQRAVGVTDEPSAVGVVEYRTRERSAQALPGRVLLGRTSAGTTADFSTSGFTAAWRFVAGLTGDLKYIRHQAKVANTASSARMGIYDDGAGGTAPGTLLGVAPVDSLADFNSATAIVTATLATSVPIVSGTAYWLDWFSAGDTHNFQGDSGGSYREVTGDHVTPWSGGGTGSVNAILWGESEPQMLTAVEQYVIPAPERVKTGVYVANTGRHALQAAAHAANDGFWFLVNPPGSGVLVAVKDITYMIGTTSTAIAFANSPRTTLERFTYTGTPSGAQVTPGKADSGQAAPQARLYTAATGMTITAGALVDAFLAFPGFSGGAASGANTAQSSAIRDGVGEWDFPTMGDPGTIVLREGEGLLYRQADAGATSETASRTATISLQWEEYLPGLLP